MIRGRGGDVTVGDVHRVAGDRDFGQRCQYDISVQQDTDRTGATRGNDEIPLERTSEIETDARQAGIVEVVDDRISQQAEDVGRRRKRPHQKRVGRGIQAAILGKSGRCIGDPDAVVRVQECCVIGASRPVHVEVRTVEQTDRERGDRAQIGDRHRQDQLTSTGGRARQRQRIGRTEQATGGNVRPADRSGTSRTGRRIRRGKEGFLGVSRDAKPPAVLEQVIAGADAGVIHGWRRVVVRRRRNGVGGAACSQRAELGAGHRGDKNCNQREHAAHGGPQESLGRGQRIHR